MSDLSVEISAQEARELDIDNQSLGDYISGCIRRYALQGHKRCRIHIDRGWDKIDEVLEDLRTLGFETQTSESPDGKIRQLYIKW